MPAWPGIASVSGDNSPVEGDAVGWEDSSAMPASANITRPSTDGQMHAEKLDKKVCGESITMYEDRVCV